VCMPRRWSGSGRCRHSSNGTPRFRRSTCSLPKRARPIARGTRIMPALRELQLELVAALFGESDGVQAHVLEAGMSADARLGIYQNNLREGFIKALALGFPVIERLGGTDYFRQLALEFLAAHPSRAGNLHHIGAPFAPFLAQK